MSLAPVADPNVSPSILLNILILAMLTCPLFFSLQRDLLAQGTSQLIQLQTGDIGQA
jgi:hypothetical protein